MIRMGKVLIPLLLFVLFNFVVLKPSRGVADEPSVVDKMIEIGRNDSHVMAHLDHICNRIGPRLTSSESLQVACDWAEAEFAAMGLESRQEQWGEFPVGFNRGPAYGWMVEPEGKVLEFGTNAWTAGTTGRERGKALLVPEDEEEWDAFAEQATGAWVLMPRAVRGRPGSGSADARRRRAEQLEKILELEPAGIVQPTRDELIVTSGRYNVEWESLPTVPQVDLIAEQWDQIAEKIQAGEEVVLEFDIRNFFKKGPIPLYNVIADIPGTEYPDEYVIVGGHLDSWDAATGATDNGAGCATAIEAARLLMEAGAKPKRTIRFMLWTGEEQGLLGSLAYVDAHPEVVDNVSAVLVHDGGTNYVAGIRCLEDMREDMEQVFAPVMDLDTRTPFDIEVVDRMRGGGSDHASFIRGGAPGFFWKQAGRAVYRQTHHTQFDTYDTVVPEYQRHSAMVIAIGALGLADLEHMLSREMMSPQ